MSLIPAFWLGVGVALWVGWMRNSFLEYLGLMLAITTTLAGINQYGPVSPPYSLFLFSAILAAVIYGIVVKQLKQRSRE